MKRIVAYAEENGWERVDEPGDAAAGDGRWEELFDHPSPRIEFTKPRKHKPMMLSVNFDPDGLNFGVTVIVYWPRER